MTTPTPTRPALQILLLIKRKPNLRFDTHHLTTVHVPLVVKHWTQHGFIDGTAAEVVDQESEYAYAITLRWESEQGWEKARSDEEGMRAVGEDVGRITDGEVVWVVGRVLG